METLKDKKIVVILDKKLLPEIKKLIASGYPGVRLDAYKIPSSSSNPNKTPEYLAEISDFYK